MSYLFKITYLDATKKVRTKEQYISGTRRTEAMSNLLLLLVAKEYQVLAVESVGTTQTPLDCQ